MFNICAVHLLKVIFTMWQNVLWDMQIQIFLLLYSHSTLLLIEEPFTLLLDLHFLFLVTAMKEQN